MSRRRTANASRAPAGRPREGGSRRLRRGWALAAAMLLLAALAAGAGYFLGSTFLRSALGLEPPRVPAGPTAARASGSGGQAATAPAPAPAPAPEPVEIPGTTLTLYRLELTGFADTAAATREAAGLNAAGFAAEPLPGGRVVLMYFESRRGAETYAAGLPAGLRPSVTAEVLRPAPLRLAGGAGAEAARRAVETLTQYLWDEARLWEEDFLGTSASAQEAVQRSDQLGRELAAAQQAWRSATSATPSPAGMEGLGPLLQLAATNREAVASWAAGSPDRQTVVEAMSTFIQLVVGFQGWYGSLGAAGGAS